MPTAEPDSVASPTDCSGSSSTDSRPSGLDVLYVENSPAGGEVFARKAIVPGLEVETMSYYRIGERGVRKLLAEGSPLVGLGDPPAGAGRSG